MRFGFAGVAAVLLWPTVVVGFEPGSLGDAYRDFGYVQGCSDAGELPGCTIIAGGSQFVAPADGQTPPEVMALLRDLPKLSYIEFRGDILNVFDSYAEIAFGAVAVADPGADPYGDLVAGMQGRWQSVDDPQSMVEVDGLIWSDVYGGEALGQSVISLAEGCSDGSVTEGLILELFTIGALDAPSMCYSVVTAAEGRMELIYLPRGNTLAFQQVE
ncbi:MAG: hypothetical protein RLZZ563_1102 [Pseudomonadota bacterium]